MTKKKKKEKQFVAVCTGSREKNGINPRTENEVAWGVRCKVRGENRMEEK